MQTLSGDVEAKAGQKLVTPYQWTTYNILVLPPSFPCQSALLCSGAVGRRANLFNRWRHGESAVYICDANLDHGSE